MLTQFRTNVRRYPRLFTLWLAGWALAAAEIYLPRLVGIDGNHALYASAAVDVVFAWLVYLWITGNTGRTAILTDILDRFEGREVCSVEGHYVSEDEYSEDVEEDLEPEPEETEEEQQ